MKSKKWKEFGKLTQKCYMMLAGLESSHESWDKAFKVLQEIVADGKEEQLEYATELYLLDEDTDYEYDVQGWLEDYLDELDMQENKERLLEVCDILLGMFSWEEDKPSDIKYLRASALTKLGKKDEAVEFCKAWLAEEPDNLVAVTANIYAFLSARDMEAAEKLIKQYIHEDTECTDENDILFTAAVECYKKSGNKKELKRMEKALDEYEKLLNKLFAEFDENGGDGFMWDDEDEEYEWGDDVLPF